ncbi:MAG: CPBP family intramembrane metalloprotease [Thermoanaerobacteraceae bacterium]|nr:CPBP family intramembrane metalloprotease [Thermoanaerobacteraceae bacterium]
MVLVSVVNLTLPLEVSLFNCAKNIIRYQIYVVLSGSKREYGRYSLKSGFSNHQKLSWWKIFIYGLLLLTFAGIMSVTIAPLENMLFAPITKRLTHIIPPYFDWNNMDYLKHYSKSILWLTCVIYFILNVFIGPIVEELFFRGYLTSKISRFKSYTPFIITVLFSLYHFWLPFNNLFRIIIFYPAAYLAWKKNNIYISMVSHCLYNLISAINFIVAVYTIL